MAKIIGVDINHNWLNSQNFNVDFYTEVYSLLEYTSDIERKMRPYDASILKIVLCLCINEWISQNPVVWC